MIKVDIFAKLTSLIGCLIMVLCVDFWGVRHGEVVGLVLVSLAESPEPGPPLAPEIPRVTAFSPRVWSGDSCLSSVCVGGISCMVGGFLGGMIVVPVFWVPGVLLIALVIGSLLGASSGGS